MTTISPDPLHTRVAALAHGGHPIDGPIMPATVETILPFLDAEYGSRVLDLGCGAAEWLIRLIDRTGCNGEGIDISEEVLEEARQQAQYRLVDPQQLQLNRGDISTYRAPQPYDAVICTGVASSCGGLRQAMQIIDTLLVSGGFLLISEGFWNVPPTQEALTGLGTRPSDYTDLLGTFGLMAAARFVPLYWHVSTQEEWDDYESTRSGSVEKYALTHPGDPDLPALLKLARARRAAYLNGYRGIFGYVTCVLAKQNG